MSIIDFNSSLTFDPSSLGTSTNFLAFTPAGGSGYTVFESTSTRWIIEFTTPQGGVAYVGFFAATTFTPSGITGWAPRGDVGAIVAYNASGIPIAIFDDLTSLGFDIYEFTSLGNQSRLVSGDDDFLGSSGADFLRTLAGNDVLDGAGGNDTLYGGDGDDLIYGSDGNDRLFGENNNDVILGEAGNDSIVGGGGDDALAPGAGDDTVDGSAGVDLISYADAPGGVNVSLAITIAQNTGGAGIDSIVNIEKLEGSAHNDTLSGGSGDDSIYGYRGADGIYGAAGADILFGDGGDDILDGGAGNDVMSGGADGDSYAVDALGDVVIEVANEGFDTVYASLDYTLGANLEGLNLTGSAVNGYGNSLANAMVGNGLANLLSGDAGDDVLTGNAGNDILQGGAGNDIMFGGLGDDSYGVDSSGDAIGENAGEGFDAVYSTGDYTLAANLEQLNLIGAAVNGFGNSVANAIFGNELANYLGGGAGDDVLTGGAGNDILEGNTGNDIMFGGLGGDSYGVDSSGDAIGENVGEGFDAVYATGDYTLGANLEQLNLIGNAVNGFGNSLANSMFGNDLANYLGGGDGDDVITGGAGNDILEGNAGNDIMFGGLGSDSYGVDASGDAIGENVGEGFDAVYSTSSYTLGANLEQLNLIGSATEGYGNGLANAIFGNALNNILNGGTGDDVLNGGAGNDTFLFLPGTGRDVISDFVAGGTDDRVDLSAYAGTGITYALSQSGGDAVFTFSNGDQIVLVGVNSANLIQSGDFWL